MKSSLEALLGEFRRIIQEADYKTVEKIVLWLFKYSFLTTLNNVFWEFQVIHKLLTTVLF